MIIDLLVDFKNRKVINVLPCAMHCDGFTYPETEEMIKSGDAVIISIEQEEIEMFDKEGWKEIEKSGKEKLYEKDENDGKEKN